MSIEKVLEFLNNISKKREIEVFRTEYGRYTERLRRCQYSDNDQKYQTPFDYNSNTEVHSSKAFTTFIKEEFSRRNNQDGYMASVKLREHDGIFVADDDFGRGFCKYERINSEQFSLIKAYRNKTLNHEGLVEMILRLKPSLITYGDISIEDGKTYYNNFFNVYSKLRINRNARMNTTPVYGADSTADNSYTCTFRITSGANEGCDEDVKIPEGFTVACPFVKAGDYNCVFNIDIQPLFNPNGIAEFSIKVPNYEDEIEKAVINEAETIKANLSEYPKLLVLADL